MAGNLQPLVSNQRIVNADGTPTEYFIRWAQAKQIDLKGAITAQEALQIIIDYLLDHMLQEGTGIEITPTGNISDSPTISANIQTLLDEISTDWGTILFRGDTEWLALAPGTAGDFLKTNGPGADPEWAAGGGGGGGGNLVKLNQTIVAGAPAASITFAAIPATYDDLIVVIDGQLTGNADFVWGALNGDTGANYHWARGYFQTTGIGFGTGTSNGLDMGLIDGAATLAGAYGGTLECTIYNYARTEFRKRSMARSSLRTGSAANGLNTEAQSSEWNNTAAVNSITLTPNSGSFVVGTVATLYARGGAGGGGGGGGGDLLGFAYNNNAVVMPSNVSTPVLIDSMTVTFTVAAFATIQISWNMMLYRASGAIRITSWIDGVDNPTPPDPNSRFYSLPQFENGTQQANGCYTTTVAAGTHTVELRYADAMSVNAFIAWQRTLTVRQLA